MEEKHKHLNETSGRQTQTETVGNTSISDKGVGSSVSRGEIWQESNTNVSGKRRVSEAEARMLLAEETRKTHQKLDEADKKNKK